MPGIIYEWPQDWYRATTSSLFLQSRSQSLQSPWTTRRSVYGPHAQFWVLKIGLVNLADPMLSQVGAFFSRLDGTAGRMRIGSMSHRYPQYNKEVVETLQTFSDGRIFTDGTGFSSGLLPPTAFVALAALRGQKNLQIGGLLPSITRALRRGDKLEIRPNGVAADIPHYYEVVVDGNTDANGKTGVEIRPAFHGGIAIGDQVVLTNPTSIFRVVDESQNEMQIMPPVLGSLGFTLIEALV